MSSDDKNARFKFFFPDARVLSEVEIDSMPPEKKLAAEAGKKKGVWLEIHCPEGSCVGDNGRITIPAVGTESPEEKGIWLNLFCPEGSCELQESTQLP